MTKRLLAIAAPVKKQLVVSTLASIVGNLSQMSIMAFGALLLLSAAGYDTYFSPAFSFGFLFLFHHAFFMKTDKSHCLYDF